MMKIQSLAVIAIVILLPMTLILSSYISSQAKTLSYQVEYDARLQNSTYDALKAFQMNTANSDTSDIANSKIRDVKAGANSFFDSLANNFNMPGYDKETLSQYVPAVVFTMYDGYYIYSPYENRLDRTNVNVNSQGIATITDDIYTNGGEYGKSSDAAVLQWKAEDGLYDPNDGSEIGERDIRYKDGDDLTGLKPYVYYSARYVKDGSVVLPNGKIATDIDVTITYALDNYIVIHGKEKVDGVINAIDISGYLLTDVEYSPDPSTGKLTKGAKASYRDITIDVEGNDDNTLIKERTFISKQAETDDSGGIDPAVSIRALVPCRMINGVRYYNLGTAFSEPYTDKSGRTVTPQGIWALLNGSWRQQNYASTTEITREELDLSKVRAQDVIYNSNAVEYYKDAFEFKDEIKNAGLKDLTVGDMMIDYTDNSGNFKSESYEDLLRSTDSYSKQVAENISYLGDYGMNIFAGLGSGFPNGETGIDIEEPKSNFNEHRLGIIRYVIEKNLSNAINNFNTYSTTSTNFLMPKLSEEEWTYIYDNLCVISFMQGLSIGGKIYNGHAVVPNTDNKEVVTEDSIYIAGKEGSENKIYKATYKNTTVFNGINSSYARWKMDFKRASTEDVNNGTIEYFYRYPEKKSNYSDWLDVNTIIGLKNLGSSINSPDKCYRYTSNNNPTDESELLKGEKEEAWYAYDSIVNTTGNYVLGSEELQAEGITADNMYDYMEELSDPANSGKYPNGYDLAKAYFTALARARWGMYRVENPVFETAYPETPGSGEILE